MHRPTIDPRNLALLESGDDDLARGIHGIQTSSHGIETEAKR